MGFDALEKKSNESSIFYNKEISNTIKKSCQSNNKAEMIMFYIGSQVTILKTLMVTSLNARRIVTPCALLLFLNHSIHDLKPQRGLKHV